jgi:hypothetical protein
MMGEEARTMMPHAMMQKLPMRCLLLLLLRRRRRLRGVGSMTTVTT